MNDSFPTFDEELFNLQQVIERLPDALGRSYVNFTDENFQQEGFRNTGLTPWQQRKRNTGNQRALLVKTGRLRNSIRYRREGMSVIISSDVPYAKPHNEGLNRQVTVRSHNRTRYGRTHSVNTHQRNISMPKRQFMGKSRHFEQLFSDFLDRELSKFL